MKLDTETPAALSKVAKLQPECYITYHCDVWLIGGVQFVMLDDIKHLLLDRSRPLPPPHSEWTPASLIAAHIQRWLDFNDGPGATDDTNIYAPPVWSTRGQLKSWIKVLRFEPGKEHRARYKIEEIKDSEVPQGKHYRVSHIESDSRVATCYLRENAELVTSALNSYGNIR